MKLSQSQRNVLTRLADGGVLLVRMERTATGVRQRCWIGSLELQPMTVNALITAGLVSRQGVAASNDGGRTTSYTMSYTGQVALQAP